MMVLVLIVFAAVTAIIVAVAAKNIGQWRRNNQSPVLTVEARVVAKRRHDSHYMQQMGDVSMPMEDTTYFATFQVPSGDRMELRLPGREYGLLAEGDQGQLTSQGTRYLSFVRQW